MPTTTRAKRVTKGVSPKTILAGVIPAIGTVLAVFIQFAVTGEIDKAEETTALVGLSSSFLSALAAYCGNPGNVTVKSD